MTNVRLFLLNSRGNESNEIHVNNVTIENFREILSFRIQMLKNKAKQLNYHWKTEDINDEVFVTAECPKDLDLEREVNDWIDNN